ncbi:MAG: haloacid dehalogenase type II [Rhodomicrobium sp.]|nr:haloacid dehalogenase type II [Rhodomicrobium sp.]
MALSPVKAVLFDAYGTLFDVHSPVAKLAAEIGPNANAVSDLARSSSYPDCCSLMGAHADFAQVTADALDFALSQHNVSHPSLRDQLLNLYMTLSAYPDAVGALRTLRAKGIGTGILSNGSPEMLEAAVGSAGLTDLLDHVLSVESVGIYKPHPRVYRLGEERCQLPANMIGFVSANGWDAAGAAHYGFQVVHLNRFDQPTEKLPAGPALLVKTLDEAAAAIG